ncbi:MAG TPA: hypothetical protein VG965_02150 [Patescibacteria group bacterium]|nr:hypothetical protein [Patescibacteria group bacterium]
MIETLETRESEQEKLKVAFYTAAGPGTDSYFDGPKAGGLLPLGNSIAQHQTVVRATTDLYLQDRKLYGNLASRHEIPTLSPNIRLVHYAKESPFDDSKLAIHVLDDFETETQNRGDLAANLTYLNAFTDGLLNGKGNTWNIAWGDFRRESYHALSQVREYIVGLSDEEREKLSEILQKIGQLNDVQLLMQAETLLGTDFEVYSRLTSNSQYFGNEDNPKSI